MAQLKRDHHGKVQVKQETSNEKQEAKTVKD